MERYADPPIHRAAAKGNLRRVKELLDADPGLPNLKRCGGLAPLDRAASLGHTRVARLLLARGADVNTRSRGPARQDQRGRDARGRGVASRQGPVPPPRRLSPSGRRDTSHAQSNRTR